MSKYIGITLLLLSLSWLISAQQTWNYAEVDKKSYDLFLQKNWKGLLEYSEQARGHNIDFFYLQARSGIASYNLKKYREAAKWFLLAFETDQSFDWLQEYLYFSLVYSGREMEAEKFAKNFSPEMKRKTGVEKHKITRIAAEAGYCFNPDFEELLAAPHDVEAAAGADYGEAFYFKNYNFQTLDLNHRVSPGFMLNHSVTLINIAREEKIDWGNQNKFQTNTTQFQYFINPVLVAGKKTSLSASLNVAGGTASYMVGGLNANLLPYFYASEYKISDIIFSASGWSHFGNFSTGAEINSGNINNVDVTQLSGWITYYPFSNANFYLTPRVYFKSGSGEKISYNTFGISGGAQLGKLHFYGQYLSGEMENFIEAGGYVVSNFPGVSNQKFSGSLYFPTGKKYQLVLRYINQSVDEKYRVYVNGVENNSISYRFTKQTFTGGISWNF